MFPEDPWACGGKPPQVPFFINLRRGWRGIGLPSVSVHYPFPLFYLLLSSTSLHLHQLCCFLPWSHLPCLSFPTICLHIGGEHLSLAEQWAHCCTPSITSATFLTDHQACATRSPSTNECCHHSSPESEIIYRGHPSDLWDPVRLICDGPVWNAKATKDKTSQSWLLNAGEIALLFMRC